MEIEWPSCDGVFEAAVAAGGMLMWFDVVCCTLPPVNALGICSCLVPLQRPRDFQNDEEG